MTMHFTMFVASLFVNSDNGYLEAKDETQKEKLASERSGFLAVRIIHFILGFILLVAILLKNRAYFITASFIKHAGLLTYILVSIYLRWDHEINYMDG
jgi:Ni,Fe-hydrogenase I cytochrome b subunit